MSRPSISFRASIALVVIAVFIAGSAWYRAENRDRARSHDQYIPPAPWLHHRIGIVGPLTHWRGRVRSKTGDEILFFSSPPQTWSAEMGTAGECLVRNGQPIDGYVTVVN